LINDKLEVILKQASVAQSRYDPTILPGRTEDSDEIFSLRITGFLIKILKGQLPNTSLKHCRYSNLLGGKMCLVTEFKKLN
jgi:hypothetical protein